MIGIEPEFVDMPDRVAAVMARDFKIDTRGNIPALYKAYFGLGSEIEHAETDALYGISFAMDGKGGFRYCVGRVLRGDPDAIPDELERVGLVGGTYAVFRSIGPVADIPPLFDWIFESWIPNSGVSVASDPVIERYPNDANNNPDSMAFEIWVPIRR